MAEQMKKIEHVDIDFGGKHTWTIYFLIDIKIVYIISYAYISIINLISSTASIEATDDKHADVEFQISSTDKGHVTNISDAVLWNCRAHSASSYYYNFLYGMLFVALGLALGGFAAAKVFTLICDVVCASPERGLTKLWHIAVFQKNKSYTEGSVEKLKKIPIDVFKEVIYLYRLATLFPFIVLFLLVAGMVISYLSYDLHPLACLRGQDGTSIVYDSTAETVEINISGGLLNFQLPAGIIVVIHAILILIAALCFYYFNYCIIQVMRKHKSATIDS